MFSVDKFTDFPKHQTVSWAAANSRLKGFVLMNLSFQIYDESKYLTNAISTFLQVHCHNPSVSLVTKKKILQLLRAERKCSGSLVCGVGQLPCPMYRSIWPQMTLSFRSLSLTVLIIKQGWSRTLNPAQAGEVEPRDSWERKGVLWPFWSGSEVTNTLHVTGTNLIWCPGPCESQDLLTFNPFSERQATSLFEESLGVMRPEFLFLYSCTLLLWWEKHLPRPLPLKAAGQVKQPFLGSSLKLLKCSKVSHQESFHSWCSNP